MDKERLWYIAYGSSFMGKENSADETLHVCAAYGNVYSVVASHPTAAVQRIKEHLKENPWDEPNLPRKGTFDCPEEKFFRAVGNQSAAVSNSRFVQVYAEDLTFYKNTDQRSVWRELTRNVRARPQAPVTSFIQTEFDYMKHPDRFEDFPEGVRSKLRESIVDGYRDFAQQTLGSDSYGECVETIQNTSAENQEAFINRLNPVGRGVFKADMALGKREDIEIAGRKVNAFVLPSTDEVFAYSFPNMMSRTKAMEDKSLETQNDFQFE